VSSVVIGVSRTVDRLVGGSGEDGQGLAEYALILALIAIVAIVALIFLGGQVSGVLSKVGKSI
jgi:pilus assembly protein Flp/PilA